MKKILSLVCNLFMQFRHETFCFLSALRTLNFPGKRLLSLSESIERLFQELWILDGIAIGINQKMFQSDIYADNFLGSRKLPGGDIITGKGDKPFPRSYSANRYRFDPSFNRSGELELERTDIGNDEVVVFDEFPTTLLQRERVVAVFGFETREAGFALLAALKECLECAVKTLKNVLKHLRTDLGKFWKCLFQFRQLILLGVKRYRLAELTPQHYSLLKPNIVERAAKFQPAQRIRFGYVMTISAILKRPDQILLCSAMMFGMSKKIYVDNKPLSTIKNNTVKTVLISSINRGVC